MSRVSTRVPTILSVSLWYEDDYPADRSTTGELTVGGSIDGVIERSQDEDWFRVRLETDKYYRFTVVGGQGADRLSAPTIGGLRDSVGMPVGSMGDSSGLNQEPTLVEFQADYDDIYYVMVRASGNETGSYTLAMTDFSAEIAAEGFPLMVGTELVHDAKLVGEVSADVSGAGLILVNEPIISTIDIAHDVDWYRVTLDANVTYQIDMYGSSVGALDDSGIWHPAFTLFDPLLSGVYAAAGVLIPGSGDTTTDGDAGDGKNSRFFVTPDGDGDYYIEATGMSAWTGTYGLNVVIFNADTPDEPEPGLNNPATGAPAITGTARVGETLTADTSGIADTDGLSSATFSYQWIASDGTTEADITGATGSAHTLVDADKGQTIKVEVSFTDDAGHEETLTSAATGAVAAKPDSPATGAPQIGGAVQVGETLTADVSGIADADGLDTGAFSYRWLADDIEITGATSSKYTLTSDDEGKSIKVRVSFTDDAENEETLTSAATAAVLAAPQSNSPATGAPTISGAAQVGETLTAETSGIEDEDGLDNAAYTYQWLADDTEITGATSSSYTLAPNDEGNTIQVRVSFTDDAENEETLTSAATAAVAAAEPEPQEPPAKPTGLSGTVAHNAVSLSWDDPEDDSITGYQILRRNRAVDAPGQFQVHVEDTGSAATSHVDRDVEPDTRYVYRIKAHSAGGLSGRSDYFGADIPPEPEPEPEPNSPATGLPAISGAARVGETLTADTSGIADTDGLDSAAFSYQWVATDGGAELNIGGATGAAYTLLPIDAGLRFMVRVSFTDDAGNEETLTSAATAVVAE